MTSAETFTSQIHFDQLSLIPSIKDRQAETANGTNQPNSRALDVRVYALVIDLLEGKLQKDIWTIKPPASIPPQPVIAVAHEAFLKHNSDFVDDFVDGRVAAYQDFSLVVEAFNRNQLSVHPPKTLLTPVPAFMLQLDDINHIARDLNIDPSIIKGMSEEIPWNKAQDHYILGHSGDSGHDYPSYVRDMATKTGLTIAEFIKRQQLHELVQLLTHPLTERRFSLVRTWYNEGSGEYWSRFTPRSKLSLQGADEIPKLETLLEGDGTFDPNNLALFHATSHLLISAISKAYSPDDPDQGFFTFSQRLFGDWSKSDTHLSGQAKRILLEDVLADEVENQLQTVFKSMVKG